MNRLPLLVATALLLSAVLVACSNTQAGWTLAPVPSGSAAPPGSPAAGSPGVSTPAPGSAAPSTPLGTPNSSGSPPPASGAPIGSGTVGDTLQISAQNIAFSTDELQAPAGSAFIIEFENRDAGIPHNVEIRDGGGTVLYQGEIFNGVAARTYQVPAIGSGTYEFICTVHPNMKGSLVAA
jgi:plastocyanin